ncbi:MAG: ABC transporter permease subunit, partial [Pseudomonadota bacterium]|nr:ABC transporter permease subunit [Pseudomonadota bacterium]
DSNSTNKKRQRSDRWSRYVVTGFGGLVLLTLVILITHLISQALPLAYTPSLQHLSSFKTQDNEEIISAGDIINSQPLLVRKSDCRLGLKLLKGDSLESNHDYIRPCEHRLSAHSVMGENYIVDVSPNAQVRVLPVRSFNMGDSTAVDIATSAPQATLSNNITFALPKEKWRERDNWNMALSSKWAVVSISKGNSVFIRWVNRLRPTQVVDKRFYNVDRLVLLPGSESVLLQIEDALYLNRLSDKGASLLPIISGIDASLDENIIFPLAKDRTFFLTNTKTQTLTRWVLSKSEKGLTFKPTYQIALPGETVRDVAEHASMNLVAVLTDKARVLLVNRVSGDVVASQQIERTAENITWYGNKLYGYSGNTLSVWEGKHLSGITTWASLFEPQHYEGYGAEETVWQTTSASDFQEAKFSLTPLLIGSIKASLLALLIAIPVAIGAAIYTAFFAKSRLRNIIKPAIELLEAIPSVLIGFIAAIWLSPKAEQFLFSFAFFLIVIPFVLIVVALVQRPIAEYLPKKLRHGAELLFAIGGVFFLGFISVEYAPALIFSVMGVDGFMLLASESNSPIGKTTIVVALALGVAISPSIYSLAEDAINGVPNDLKHASFALGATRLQTLLHVVLHVALPGIVAAIMLGFGRAFGETMIVLMVTGNTPISSWGLIEGLRALTANLAIELPEADVSSAHYQILFFTACILFLFTFLVNTIAELLRQHIRSRAYYG